ncbi:MAG: hypothetical protein IH884_06805 [Myxococcales bacterium]|nr:hypothetical protein [Myxococcales bacterium]
MTLPNSKNFWPASTEFPMAGGRLLHESWRITKSAGVGGRLSPYAL